MHPNIFVGRCEGSAMYHKWYYEAIIDHIETVSHLPPHIHIGWANTEGFIPYPGGGAHWGANGVGDDLFSYGFDGSNLWTGNDYHRTLCQVSCNQSVGQSASQSALAYLDVGFTDSNSPKINAL